MPGAKSTLLDRTSMVCFGGRYHMLWNAHSSQPSDSSGGNASGVIVTSDLLVATTKQSDS